MIVTGTQMTILDEKTIKSGVPSLKLMEQAGAKSFKVIKKKYLKNKNTKLFIFIGPGNNGGDGLVVARLALAAGYKVEVFILDSIKKLQGDSKINFYRLPKSIINSPENIADIKKHEMTGQVIVDAIFGTGLTRNITGFYGSVIDYLNGVEACKFSIDIASGISADSGEVLGRAFTADATVTFELPKVGHYINPGKIFTGELFVQKIGIPDKFKNELHSDFTLLTKTYFTTLLKKRSQDTHKNSYGHVLVVAGSLGKAGAAKLLSLASLKAGAGLVSVICPKSIHNIITGDIPELMVQGVIEKDGVLTFNGFKKAFHKISKIDVIAFGPGLGINSETNKILKFLLKLNLPMVIDADGIRLLKNNLKFFKNREASIIITPHPGEFAFLIGKTNIEIQKRRLFFAKNFAQRYNLYLLLKGNDTLIVSPSGKISINTTGTPAQANAGQGDALTGFVAANLAQRYSPKLSLELSVFLHGFSGQKLESLSGPLGVLAHEVINYYPKALKLNY